MQVYLAAEFSIKLALNWLACNLDPEAWNIRKLIDE